MIKKLKDIISDKETFAESLRTNALEHKNYKLYTSMEGTLSFLLDGYLTLSDGSKWNDCFDREQMKSRKTYGACFSWSTRENVAMWMLYSMNKGKAGAALNFPASVLESIRAVDTIEIVKMPYGNEKDVLKTIKKGIDFDLFFTDIVYFDTRKDSSWTTVSYLEKHEHVQSSILDHDRIYRKQYEWRYENESRLIVGPFDKILVEIERMKKEIEGNEDERGKRYIALRIKVPKYKMMKNRVIRSPIYQGKAFYGEPSALQGKVEWDL